MPKIGPKPPFWHTFSFLEFRFHIQPFISHCQVDHPYCLNYGANAIETNPLRSRSIMTKWAILTQFSTKSRPFPTQIFWQNQIPIFDSNLIPQLKVTIWCVPLRVQCKIAIGNCYNATLIPNMLQNDEKWPKMFFLTHILISVVSIPIDSIRFTLPHYRYTLSRLRCKLNSNQCFTITLEYCKTDLTWS